MESRKEMTIPVSNDIIFYKESDKSERIKEKMVKKKKIMVALAIGFVAVMVLMSVVIYFGYTYACGICMAVSVIIEEFISRVKHK